MGRGDRRWRRWAGLCLFLSRHRQPCLIEQLHDHQRLMYRNRGFGAGPDGHILDGYEVQTSTGRKLLLYIDMYHPTNDPAKQLAPKGLFKVG